MIPKKTLVGTINQFEEKYNKLNDELNKLSKESKENWSLEKFEEWYKMQKAWIKLADVIEFELLPFVEKN